MAKVNCDSSQRCKDCTVEQLPVAYDRVMAGGVVRSVVRAMEFKTDSLSDAKTFVEEVTTELRIPHLAGAIIGATAINITGYCKPE